MVIRHFSLVDGASAHRQFPAGKRSGNIFLIGFRQQLHGLDHPRNHVRRQEPAVRTWIGQRLMFLVQALGGFQRLVCGKSQQAVGIPLQAGQVVQLRRKLLLPDGFRLDHGTGSAFDLSSDLFRGRFFLQMCIRVKPLRKINAAVVTEVRGQCAEILRFEVFDLLPAFHEDRQRRGLNASDGQECLVLQRERPAGVHSDQPVRFAPAAGAFVQAVVIGARTDIPESFTDGLVRHGRDPQTLKRFFAASFFIDIPEDQFTLTPCVRSADQRIRFFVVYQFFDCSILFFCLGDHFQGNGLRKNRQCFKGPLFILPVQFVGLHQRYQMTQRPGHDVVFPDQAAVSAGPAAEHPGNIPAHTGFLSHYNDLSHTAPPDTHFIIIPYPCLHWKHAQAGACSCAHQTRTAFRSESRSLTPVSCRFYRRIEIPYTLMAFSMV